MSKREKKRRNLKRQKIAKETQRLKQFGRSLTRVINALKRVTDAWRAEREQRNESAIH